MRRAFADTCYWIALANPHDQWNVAANNAGRSLETAQIVTTDEVMVEFLTMETMREYALAEVLTNDRHFVQEGFSVLWEG
jgi:predicted nucleic acid-binding protein